MTRVWSQLRNLAGSARRTASMVHEARRCVSARARTTPNKTRGAPQFAKPANQRRAKGGQDQIGPPKWPVAGAPRMMLDVACRVGMGLAGSSAGRLAGRPGANDREHHADTWGEFWRGQPCTNSATSTASSCGRVLPAVPGGRPAAACSAPQRHRDRSGTRVTRAREGWEQHEKRESDTRPATRPDSARASRGAEGRCDESWLVQAATANHGQPSASAV